MSIIKTFEIPLDNDDTAIITVEHHGGYRLPTAQGHMRYGEQESPPAAYGAFCCDLEIAAHVLAKMVPDFVERHNIWELEPFARCIETCSDDFDD